MEDHQFLPNAEMADGVVNPIGLQDPQKFSWVYPITPVEPVAVPSLSRENRDVTSTQLPLVQHRCMIPLLAWRRTIDADTNKEVERTVFGTRGVVFGTHDPPPKLS